MEKVVKKFPAGVVVLPPSKSVAHRAVICAALAEGRSMVHNLALSQDIQATLGCMRQLGAVENYRGATARIEGARPHALALLHCGESGSTLRFLIPLVAVGGGGKLTGAPRLMERPLAPYFDCLPPHGVELTLQSGILHVRGDLQAGNYSLRGDVSSQFISGLLFALPLLEGDSVLTLSTPLESASYVEVTRAVMAQFGVSSEWQENSLFIKGGQRYRPCEITVEGDYSQAGFFLVASALGRHCECRGLRPDSAQGDRKILQILENSGVHLAYTAEGGIVAKAGELVAQTVDVGDIPDLVPPLAALLAVCKGESRILGAGRLRLKESDRLASVTSELNALGADVRIEGDSLIIQGKPKLVGGIVHSHNDHRIAMMGAVAAIACMGTVTVQGAECVAKSYPQFWDDFEKAE